MSDLSLPSLVTVAHGTRRAGGNEIARQITRGAGVALGVESTAAYVELSEPLLADVVAGLDSPAVVVPLLLSTGFHVRTDLPRACAGGPVVLGRPLGPDPLLAAAQVARLVAAGIEPGRPLVLVAAGSTDPVAWRDLRAPAPLLAAAGGPKVRTATLGGLGPRPETVLTPDDAVSPYLLSPGLFSRRLAEQCEALSVPCADVIGPHPLVVDLVVERYRDLAAGARATA
ncbi:sirohydrochlorin chelatase [Nocardioides sp.]|uniref:sirohydrochlorin chelatase n=1 Tax=Nocardioides sp. TaxID=35761 RepID=UPI0035176E1B